MSTDASNTPSASTPSTSAAPAEAAPGASASPTPTAAPPVNRAALHASLNRTLSIKQKEAALAKDREALAPLAEMRDLYAGGKVTAAVRKLAGDEQGLISLYNALTDELAGSAQQKREVSALPDEVRAVLASVPEMKKELEGYRALDARLKGIEEKRDSATAALEDRRREQVGTAMFTSGLAALQPGSDEALFLEALPEGQARLSERWLSLLEEKRADIEALPMEQRQAAVSALVPDAVRALREDLTKQFGPLLRLPQGKGKMAGYRGGLSTPRAASTAAPAAPSTPGVNASPKTVMPGSLGQSDGLDRFRKMTPAQRVAELKREARAAAASGLGQ